MNATEIVNYLNGKTKEELNTIYPGLSNDELTVLEAVIKEIMSREDSNYTFLDFVEVDGMKEAEVLSIMNDLNRKKVILVDDYQNVVSIRKREIDVEALKEDEASEICVNVGSNIEEVVKCHFGREVGKYNSVYVVQLRMSMNDFEGKGIFSTREKARDFAKQYAGHRSLYDVIITEVELDRATSF